MKTDQIRYAAFVRDSWICPLDHSMIWLGITHSLKQTASKILSIPFMLLRRFAPTIPPSTEHRFSNSLFHRIKITPQHQLTSNTLMSVVVCAATGGRRFVETLLVQSIMLP
jgi:hypothetical protein